MGVNPAVWQTPNIVTIFVILQTLSSLLADPNPVMDTHQESDHPSNGNEDGKMPNDVEAGETKDQVVVSVDAAEESKDAGIRDASSVGSGSRRLDDEPAANERTSLLKTSRSLAVMTADQAAEAGLAAEYGLLPKRPSLIHQSLSRQMKRASFAAIETRKKTDSESSHLPAGWGRRLSATVMKTATSYGTIYPPLYQKLNQLHRMSFADVVERITLTWDKVNVYAPTSITDKTVFAPPQVQQ